MLTARPAALSGVSLQKRSPVCTSTGVNAPVLRPAVVCRFKEDDRLEDSKQRVKEAVKDTSDDVKSTAADIKDSLKSNTNGVADSLKSNASSVTDNIKGNAQNIKGQLQSAPQTDPTAVEVNPAIPAFTRRREVWAGRLAMVGFVAACYWEYYFANHPNILQQISALSGGSVTPSVALVGIVGLIAYNLISASAPGSPTFSDANQRDVEKRPKPASAHGDGAPLNPKTQLGVTGFGFTKRNELFVGRVAMIGFAAAIIGQLMMGGVLGPGPLAQVANYLGTPAETLYASAPTVFLGWVGTITTLAYLGGKPGTNVGEDEIY